MSRSMLLAAVLSVMPGAAYAADRDVLYARSLVNPMDTPLGRAGQPAELAGANDLLAREGRYMSGALIPVTGDMPMM